MFRLMLYVLDELLIGFVRGRFYMKSAGDMLKRINIEDVFVVVVQRMKECLFVPDKGILGDVVADEARGRL